MKAGGLNLVLAIVLVGSAGGVCAQDFEFRRDLDERILRAASGAASATPARTTVKGDDFEVEFGLAPVVARRELIHYNERETFAQQLALTWRQKVGSAVKFGYELRTGLESVRAAQDELSGFRIDETQRTLLQQRVTMDWSLSRAWSAELAVDQRLSTVAQRAGTEEARGASAALTWQVWRGAKVRGEAGCVMSEDLNDVELTRTRRALRVEQAVPGWPLVLRGLWQVEELDRELMPWAAREVRQSEGSLTWNITRGASWTVGAQQTEAEQVEWWIVESRQGAWSQWQVQPSQDTSVRARALVEQRGHSDPWLSYDYDPTMQLETGWQTKWTDQFQTGFSVKYRSFDTVTPARMDDEETILSLGAAGTF